MLVTRKRALSRGSEGSSLNVSCMAYIATSALMTTRLACNQVLAWYSTFANRRALNPVAQLSLRTCSRMVWVCRVRKTLGVANSPSERTQNTSFGNEVHKRRRMRFEMVMAPVFVCTLPRRNMFAKMYCLPSPMKLSANRPTRAGIVPLQRRYSRRYRQYSRTQLSSS